jgi:pimeloyl-ACP methyl ester carboxylesterase
MQDRSATNIDPIRHVQALTIPHAVDSVEFDHDDVRIREHVTELQTPAGRLVGIISTPTGDAPAPCCLVVVNSGALRHTGPNRMFVEIARRAAASGVSAARFDLPGLGDSDGNAIRNFERTVEHDADGIAIFAQIYEHLRTTGVADRFVPMGLCLGGYLAMRTAVEDKRSIGGIGFNVPALLWTDALRKTLLKGVLADAGLEVTSAERARDNLARPLRTVVNRLERMRYQIETSARRRLARVDFLWRIEHRADLAATSGELDRLGVAGTSLFLLQGEREPLLRLLNQPKLAAKLQRWPQIEVERLPTRDHNLRPLWIQEMLFERVSLALRELRSIAEPREAPGNGERSTADTRVSGIAEEVRSNAD